MSSNRCEHDFQAILFCYKCQAKYDIAMVEIINQAKFDAVNQFVQEIKKCADEQKDINNAIDIAMTNFESHLKNDNTEVMILGTNQNVE